MIFCSIGKRPKAQQKQFIKTKQQKEICQEKTKGKSFLAWVLQQSPRFMKTK